MDGIIPIRFQPQPGSSPTTTPAIATAFRFRPLPAAAVIRNPTHPLSQPIHMEHQELRDLVTDEDYDHKAERVREEKEAILNRRAKQAERRWMLSQQPRVKSFAELVKKGRQIRSNRIASDDDGDDEVVMTTEARGEEVELDDGEGGVDGEQDEEEDGQGGVAGGDTRASSPQNDVTANSGDDAASDGGPKGLYSAEAKAGRNVEFIADDGAVMVHVSEYVLPSSSQKPPIKVSRPCEGRLGHGCKCIVVKGKKVCTPCKRRERKRSIKGVVNRLIATGQLGSVEESMSLKIASKGDVIALGLDRGSEIVLLQPCRSRSIRMRGWGGLRNVCEGWRRGRPGRRWTMVGVFTTTAAMGGTLAAVTVRCMTSGWQHRSEGRRIFS